MKKLSVILIAILFGAFLGSIIEPGKLPYQILETIGKLFLQALTLIVTPLVVSSILTGVKRISDEAEFGKLGLTILGTFVIINLTAIVIGVVVANISTPGVGFIWPKASLALPKVAEKGLLGSFLLEIIPSNVLDAFAKGKLLGLVFFSTLFGYAIAHISKEEKKFHAKFWEGIFKAMLKITGWIMLFLPLGVFCLIATTFADLGFQILKPLMGFIKATVFALAFLALGVMPIVLKSVAKIPLIPYFRAIFPALITAFSTGSSSATLPVILECLEKRVGVSNKITSLVVPLGITLNLSGTALYLALGGVFVAQVFGIPLSLSAQLYLIGASLVMSLGMASVPGGGIVAIMALLKLLGLPVEGIAIFMAVDRLLDMLRTSTNLICYSTSTCVVARKMGEKPLISTIF